MNKKILVVDDEPEILDLVSINLRAANFAVMTAETGTTGLKKAQNSKPDLILLDLLLPEMPGIEVCKILKRDPQTQAIPIIIVTAKIEMTDRVFGFESGADDYIPKPFSPRELVLRVQSFLRRHITVSARSTYHQNGVLTVDCHRHEVRVKGIPVELTATEFRLLDLLLEHRGKVQNREYLLNHVWGHESLIDTRTVDAHMRRLREKLGRASSYIETIRNVGYRMHDSNEK